MKRRWKIAIVLGVLGAVMASPILYIETSCSGPPMGWTADAPYQSVDPATTGKRPEARSWLTYPEWYIVYSAESYGRYLAQGKRPSGYSYGRDIAGFWTGLCAVNRAAGAKEAGDAKIMLYTIGLSFSVEMAVKGFYENVFGRITEWLGGADSSTDKYNAQVWQRYGQFMHETPWYRFDFNQAGGGLWRTSGSRYRDWERRLAIGTEYTVKWGYSKLIGFGAETAMDGAAPTLTFVAKGDPKAIAAVDPRLKPGAVLPGGLVVVEAPRYAQFTELLGKMAKAGVELVEIAGNDDILVTMLMPDEAPIPAGTTQLFQVALDDRPGWRRVGVSVKTPALLALLRAPGGAEIEHVYDY